MSKDKTTKSPAVSRSTSAPKPARRKFLAGAAAATAGAATLGFPMISRADTIALRFQSTWPAKDIFHEYALDFASKVNNMSAGRLKIEVLPAGAVVKPFELLDARLKRRPNIPMCMSSGVISARPYRPNRISV